MISNSYYEYECIYPKPNWVEQDLNILFSSAMKASKECIEKSGIKNSDIAAVSLSSQRSCTIFLDKDGIEIIPMISWQDGRAVHEVEDMKRIIDSETYYKITGLPLSTTWVLPKILWLQKNEPEKWKRVVKVIQLQDYFLKKLGSEEIITDLPDASMFGLWDTDNLSWSKELLELFKIKSKMLPMPLPSGTYIGKISKKVASLSGFLAGTSICVGAGDQNSAVIGAGVIKDGDISVSIGTGGIAIVCLDKPFRDPDGMNMVTNHAISGKWQMEGLQNGAAGVFRWFRDEIATYEKMEAEKNNEDVYKILDRMIKQIPAGSKGLVMLPYLAGSATPYWNTNARGTIIGLTFAHDRACLARCFIEGITLEMKDIINSFNRSGIKVDNIKMIGGASKSDIWNQIQSDMYKTKSSILKHSDAAIIGAAIFAGVGCKAFESIEKGVEKMVAVDKTYNPGSDCKIYDDLYKIYCNAYRGLEDNKVFEFLANLQSKY